MKKTTDNRRFAVMRGVYPQKVLSDFPVFTPARTFVNPALQQAADRYKQAEKKDNYTMTMKFLLHKDKKEKGSPPHIQAHLALPDTKANASQSQKSLHFPNAQTDR